MRRAREVVRKGRRDGRFLATLPRSGTNWLVAMVESALNLSHGEDGDYDLVARYFASGDEGWKPRGARHYWPNSMLSLVFAARTSPAPIPETVVIGAHFPITHGITDLGASGRPVVLVREPVAAFESLLQKEQRRAPVTPQRAMALARAFVTYFDYWSEIERRRGGDVLVVRFEDLCVDAAGQLRGIAAHWSLMLSDSTIDRAVELCSRDRMAAKAAGDTSNVRVSLEPASVDPVLLEQGVGILSDHLDAPFGYEIVPPAARS